MSILPDVMAGQCFPCTNGPIRQSPAAVPMFPLRPKKLDTFDALDGETRVSLRRLALAVDLLTATSKRLGFYMGVPWSHEDETGSPTELIEDLTDQIRQVAIQMERQSKAAAARRPVAAAAAVETPERRSDPTEFLAAGPAGALLSRLMKKARQAPEDPSDLVEELDVALRQFSIKRRRVAQSAEMVECVHEIGVRLFALMQALGYSPAMQWNEADAWAQALNREGRGQFSIFLVETGDRIDPELMAGGGASPVVREVRSWGVRNSRQEAQCRALVG